MHEERLAPQEARSGAQQHAQPRAATRLAECGGGVLVEVAIGEADPMAARPEQHFEGGVEGCVVTWLIGLGKGEG